MSLTDVTIFYTFGKKKHSGQLDFSSLTLTYSYNDNKKF